MTIVTDRMGDADKKEIARILADGADALENALHGLDQESAALRPQPECWSVLECVEHIALTEQGLLATLNQAKPAGVSHADSARETRFRELALNRLRRIEAPERVIPRREHQTLAQAYEAFQAARAGTMRFVDCFTGDLRSFSWRFTPGVTLNKLRKSGNSFRAWEIK